MVPFFPGRTRKALKRKYNRELKKDPETISNLLHDTKQPTVGLEECTNDLLRNAKNLTEKTIAQQRVPANKRTPKTKYFCYKEIHDEDRELPAKEIDAKKIASFDEATKKHNKIVKKLKKKRVMKRQKKIVPKQKYKRAPDGSRIKIVSQPDSCLWWDDDTDSSSSGEENYQQDIEEKPLEKQIAIKRRKENRNYKNDPKKRIDMADTIDSILSNPYMLFGSPLKDTSTLVEPSDG